MSPFSFRSLSGLHWSPHIFRTRARHRAGFPFTLSVGYVRHRSFAHEELLHDFFDQVVVDVHQTSWLVK